MCTMIILQLHSTVKPDESQSTLKLQLITLHQTHVLSFSLEMWKHRHLCMKIHKSQKVIYLSCRCHELYCFTPVLL